MKKCRKCSFEYDTSKRTCPECRKISSNKYARKKRQNKQYTKEQHRRYRNKAQAKEYSCKYRETHPEYVSKEHQSKLNKQAYQNNKDKRKASSKKYYEDNKEEFLLKRSKYKKNNPHIVATYTQKRRALKRSAKGNFTSEEWLKVQAQQNFTCNKCKVVCKLTVDHIIPLSKGGSNYISNVQGLCMPCNASKHAKIEV